MVSLLRTAIVAATFACNSSAVPILNTTSSVGRLGQPDGFNFPMIGQEGKEILFQADFGTNSSAISVYGSHGAGLIDSIENSASGFLGFGDSSLATGVSAPRLLTFVATDATSVDQVVLQVRKTNLVIANTRDAVGPMLTRFTAFSSPLVATSDGNNAYVAFQAQAGTTYQAIVLANVSLETSKVELVVVADTNTVIPGTLGRGPAKFRCLGSQAVSNDGDVVFFGSHCGTGVSPSRAVRARHSATMMLRTKPKRDHSLASASDVFPGIFRWSRDSGLSVVADGFNPIRGKRDSHVYFVAFSNPTMASDGTVAFVGETDAGNLGVFVQAGGQISAVVTTDTTVPASGGQMFSDFPYLPSVGADGAVLFYGSVNGDLSGVYSAVKCSSCTTWSLQSELVMSDTVNSQSLAFIGFGANAYSEVGRLFCAYLVLNSGVDGIWSFARKSDQPVIV